MSKRLPATPPPDTQPTTKRVHISEEYEKANKEIHRVVAPLLQAQVPFDKILAVALLQIHHCAPPEACMKSFSSELIEKNPDLKRSLQDAVQRGEYHDVMSLPILREEVPQTKGPPQSSHIDHPNSDDVKATFDAFSTPYVATFPQALLEALDSYSGGNRYSKTISIVQSSGTGKSRGVAETAKIRFSFMFNLREKLNKAQYTYPPPDDNVRQHLTGLVGEKSIRVRYAAFLFSLFTRAQEYIRVHTVNRAGTPLPDWWYTNLNCQGTAESLDPRRVEFYDEVIKLSNVCNSASFEPKLLSEDQMQETVQKYTDGRTGELKQNELNNELKTTCGDFVAFLRDQCGQEQKVPCLLVFDEAQQLTFCTTEGERTHYHLLGSVMKEISAHPVFAVFLSTNSNIRLLAPPQRLHPSLRAIEEPMSLPLVPPCTELPFDVFAWGLNDELARNGRSTLSVFCSQDVMARFGRTMWYSMHQHKYSSIIELAKVKLNPTGNFATDELAQFACLAIRVGLDFDASREIGQTNEIKLVESYMRIVFAVPPHREYMRTGTPSEPVLAEAAAQLLNKEPCEPITTLAPTMLDQALQGGFLARGERGEMVARLLWTLAYDQVPKERHRNDPIEFHKPIRVLDFLRSLFPKNHWDLILNAKPMGAGEDGPPLKKSFDGAYICFSHFIDAVDHDINLQNVYRLLLRGAALSCRRNQRSIDFLTPILFGSPDSTALRRSSTSVMQAQVKNRNQVEEVFVDPTLVQTTHPVLSIVHELGSPESSVECTPYNRKSEKHKRHYQIVARGCTSETYAVIPEPMDKIYPLLLGSNLLMEDFPRKGKGNENCASMFYQMQPCNGLYGGRKAKKGPWRKGDPEVPIESWFGKDVE